MKMSTMTPAQTFNEDQRIRWNGTDGEYWTSNQDRLDRTLAPVTGPLLTFAQPRVGSIVIDVGCGCGATTIELARAVGTSGRVVGIDLSEPMLAPEERLGVRRSACRRGDRSGRAGQKRCRCSCVQSARECLAFEGSG